MMGVKVEDSEDLSDEAKAELHDTSGTLSETTSTQQQSLTAEEKPDIVIIPPPTLQERARLEREEIEMEKARRMLSKTGKSMKRKEAGQIGQTTQDDNVGASEGGGGGDGGMGVDEVDKISITKPPCLEDQAKMVMAEVQMAKQKGQGPGQGGGSGAGSGSGTGDETGANVSYHQTVKQVCKSKNMYECMAQEAQARALRESHDSDQTEGNGGDAGTFEGSSGEDEVKYKRPPVRFKTQQELEAEAQKILRENDGPRVGEHITESDQVEPRPSVTMTKPTIEENARQIQSEIEAEKQSRKTGSGGEVIPPPTKDLE